MIFVIAHNKGGVGKTTLALNLAAIIKPRTIIDQDAHQCLIIINKLRDTPLNVISCNSRKELITALKTSAQNNDILVDCGGFDSELTRLAVAAADVIVVPGNDNLTELIGLKRFDQVLDEISHEMDTNITAHVIVSRVHHAKRNFKTLDDFLAKSKHLTRLESVIPTRKEYDLATAKGLGVTEDKRTKYSSAAKETKQLSDEIYNLALQQ